MEPMKVFSEVTGNAGKYATAWKEETGGKVIGHFCSYTPEEIITAAGALPFRILGSGGAVCRADAHLQAYSCSLVRGGLEDVLTGKLDFLDGTVFPHTCDSIQRLSDIWRMNVKDKFHLDVALPVKVNTESARTYMIEILRKFRKELQVELDVCISDERLRAAVKTHNRIRGDLARLYDIRARRPGTIDSTDVHTVSKASMVMDRKRFADALEQLVIGLDQPAGSAADRKRLVLTGALCSMPDIYQIIEESGGAVVWDDFCTGARYFEGMIDANGNLMESIADRYFTRMVCPAKHAGIYKRGEHLVRMAKERQADGVIFLLLKFCDPHAFDYPYMKEMLEKEGVPSLLFEVEDQIPSEGQLRTRCEAFIEML
jgi:bzd-type benzoyl-CoA reductase N subunit